MRPPDDRAGHREQKTDIISATAASCSPRTIWRPSRRAHDRHADAGPAVPRFEAASPRFTARHAVAVRTRRSALHIACLAAGVGPGKRADLPSHFPSVGQLRALLRRRRRLRRHRSAHARPVARQPGPRAPWPPIRSIDVVIPVHLGGLACDAAEPAPAGPGPEAPADRGRRALVRTAPMKTDGPSAAAPMPTYKSVFLPSGEADHHRGGRRRRHQRRRTGHRLLRTVPLARHHARRSASPDRPTPTRTPKAARRRPGTTSSTKLGCNYRMTDLQAALQGSRSSRSSTGSC